MAQGDKRPDWAYKTYDNGNGYYTASDGKRYNSYGYEVETLADKRKRQQEEAWETEGNNAAPYTGGYNTYNSAPEQPSLLGTAATFAASYAVGYVAGKAINGLLNNGQSAKDRKAEEEGLAAIDNFNKKKYNEAFRGLVKTYNAGYADKFEAIYSLLAMCYYNGWGVKQNKDTAFDLILEGYEHRQAICAFILGNFYSSGEFVEIDYDEAIDFYRESEQLGYDSKQVQDRIEYIMSQRR